MRVRINTSSGVPIYRQIVDQVKIAVAAGGLLPGERLESVRALSEQLVVNPTTIQRAYLELEREKVIETRRGQGTFVRDSATARRSGLTKAERRRRLLELLQNLLAEAHRLHAEPAEVRALFEAELERMLGPATPEARR